MELARRYRRTKGFCLIDLTDKDIAENIDEAASLLQQKRCEERPAAACVGKQVRQSDRR